MQTGEGKYGDAQEALLAFIAEHVTLTPDEVEEMVSLDLIRSYPKKTMLMREGECSQLSYFVLQGCVVKYYLMDGERKVTAIYTENEAIVPPAGPSDHYLYVVEDTVFSVATNETVEQYLTKFPKLEMMCRMMAERMLERYQFSFDRYRTATPEQRYRHLAEKRPDLLQRVPHYYLASYLGIQPESLSRIRRRLADRARQSV